MFTITRPASNRVDISVTGPIDSATMRRALDELIAASDGVTHGQMLYTIPEMVWPSIGAIGVEFAHMPKLFGLLRSFDRCAVLSDTGWIKTIAEVEGAILPGLAIKGFTLSERAEAEVWLSGGSA
ncbi:STAS/SEC14 domain-containing protein [Palleronia caenipelagi]|uniref:STAS/SEC14 domain-containing protein n=1 Tax=Palleronia caenipelagi TaxID=2489174 RepID=A0A547Q537_9RHOB|nr:STAS/SEC14 domain-containing protein [Palleronia caenipelagi]TRD21496.1 STAS/SEC14 domain-containing protein [Palleronia caenipelagi]